ncbi:MAG: hypothetical protein EAZ42_06045 [Verrucomicrobia bacterium]|nr:MAG: hypothetical protein EAZ42_06045 [Verrucomicrobiota bacterium]
MFALLGSSNRLLADLPNAWHIPDLQIVSGNGGTTPTMRNHRVEFSNTGTLKIFSGLQKFANSFGTADQNGGTLFYKSVDQVSWNSAPFAFHQNQANDQFWHANLNLANVTANRVIQYYMLLTFNPGPADNAYVYGGGDQSGSLVTANLATAQANPFTVRNRPAWVFHANNRVTNGDTVDFWAKVGYISDPNVPSSAWVNRGSVYYTTDGSAPTGSLGVASGTTAAASFTFSHPENNNQGGQSVAGAPMWWSASVPDLLDGLPLGTTIRYRIGFWHTDNSEEKFADYQAGTNNQIFSFNHGVVGEPVFTITSAGNGTLNGNYTTTKLFIDEIAGNSIPITFNFTPGQAATEVELVTNLDQREHAEVDQNGNGLHDGMEFNQLESIIGSTTGFYYRKYAMNQVSAGNYSINLPAAKTGAYRATARWKVAGDPNWRWFTNDLANRRDHAITVSPTDARDITVYEINTLTIEAKSSNANGIGGTIFRSTFEDLFDAPNAPRTIDGRGFNLDYITGLGVNWLWFQPIHATAVDGREIDPATGSPYNPGSPYAVKNFFEVNPWMSANFTNTEPGGINGALARQKGMESFQAFVGASDVKEVAIMLDAPFNHTGFDVEFGPRKDLFERFGDPLSETQEIRNYELRFFSRSGDYAQRAGTGMGQGPAVAPDRGDFGKWNDVRDVYFGRYDSLVNQNPSDNSNFGNERDRFYYAAPGQGTANNPENVNWTSVDFYQGAGNTIPRNITQQVWKYFAAYATHWLEKTRPAGQNRNSATEAGLTLAQRYAWDRRGIDGLRCDFGQGLPPQAWEYMINVARSKKWNFVMMAESLDGGAVTYRSNRHFDVLNENIVFPLLSAGNSPDYRAIFENRRNAYGQGLVLLNNTSHDEENYSNIWHALMRYNVTTTIDGAPMIFMGQELGVSRLSGFSFYETNFGKQVAHFKKFNSMVPGWLKRMPVAQGGAGSPFGEEFLWDAFAGSGQARRFSPALRSSNRFYLNRKADGLPKNEIWAVAKYEQANASPNLSDVVFCFVNLRTEQGPSDTFDLSSEVNGSNRYGIKPGRVYNVKNIGAFTKLDSNRRNVWLWPDTDPGPANGIEGGNLISNGSFVALNSLPVTPAGWSSAPYEVQFLKLYDVTPPPAVAAPTALGAVFGKVASSSVTFQWTAANDPEGGVSGFRIQMGTSANANDLLDEVVSPNSRSISLPFGTTVFARVAQINAAGVQGPFGPSSSPVQLLDPALDADGDGQTNGAEAVAGTDMSNPTSVLSVSDISIFGNQVNLTFASVIGKTYRLETSTTLEPGSWTTVGSSIVAIGISTVLSDPTGAPGPRRFYRVRVP